ncbi:MAG: GIY-YIG nuclease family protein [Shimia sp.]
MSTALGRTIQLYLVDGKPTGLRKATLHGWTGVVLVAGDATFAQLTGREEIDRAGVYVLHGPDPDGAGTRSYIGSANSVATRIRQSAEKRGFWETAIAITTSDDALSKGHVEYLEARMIEKAAASERTILDNGTAPDPSRRRLPEADVANMEQFLLNVELMLPVVGLTILKPQPSAVRGQTAPSPGPIFELQHKSGIHTEAVEQDGEFVVLTGTEALADTGQVQGAGAARLKEALVSDGSLRREGSRFVFTRPVTFSSPSTASSVILDRSSNGRTAWRVKGTNTTYHDHQQAQEAP